MKGIDVAKWQGTINWSMVRSAGVEFAILKIIDKTGKMESSFAYNFAEAAAQELPIGVYNYSYATSIAKAQADAKKVLEALHGRELSYKVWLDMEDDCQKGLERQLIELINEYKAVIEGNGYEFGVYTGLSFYNSYIRPYATLLNCPFWIARYPSNKVMHIGSEPSTDKKPDILHTLWGWQYSSKGRIPGIAGDVDLNKMYTKPETEAEQAGTKNPYARPDYTLYRYRPQMNKEYICWLQYELNEMEYGLAVDGIFGKATDAALRDAQKQFGITVDGMCGPVTRLLLTQ